MQFKFSLMFIFTFGMMGALQVTADETPQLLSLLSQKESCVPLRYRPTASSSMDWVSERAAARDAWLAEHPEKNAPITSQVGQADPVRITRTDLSQQRRRLIKNVNRLLGQVQDSCAPLRARVYTVDLGLTAQQMQRANITAVYEGSNIVGYRQGLRDYYGSRQAGKATSARVYRVVMNDQVGQPYSAFMLVPEGVQGPLPLVIAIHQTVYDCGARESLGACMAEEGGQPWMALGMEMTRRAGAVTIMPDMNGYGSLYDPDVGYGLEYNTARMKKIRSYFPDTSVIGAEVLYLRRAMRAAFEVQSELGIELKEDVGVIGHSKGGTLAVALATQEPQVKYAVSSAGSFNYNLRKDTLGIEDPTHPNFLKGFLGRFCEWAYLGEACRYIDRLEELPVEAQSFIALALGTNRALFMVTIEDDRLPSGWPFIEWLGQEGQRLAGLLGGEFGYEIVRSGLKEGDGIPCYHDAGTDPAKIYACQIQYGYMHGIYYRPMNMFMDRMTDLLN